MLVFSTSSLCSDKTPQANNLVIFYLNIRSIRYKFGTPRKPDFIALSETWLKSSEKYMCAPTSPGVGDPMY